MIAALLVTAAVAAAETPTVAVGLGTRDTLTEPGHVEGLRAIGRLEWERWAAELALYATPTTHREWSYEDPWDELPHVEDFADIDQASAALLLDWGPGYDEAGPRWQLRPHILAGAEARRTVRRYRYSILCYDAPVTYALVEPTPTWAFGPDLGVGLTVHAGPRVALRLAAMDRTRVSVETHWLSGDVLGNDYLLLRHDLTASADLLVRF